MMVSIITIMALEYKRVTSLRRQGGEGENEKALIKRIKA
jgi:hypothetical protein